MYVHFAGIDALSGGTAAISGGVAAGQTMQFDGAGGTLGLFNLPAFSGSIGGFSAGDRIDLGGFAFDGGETCSFVEAASNLSGTLTVVDGAKTATLHFLGSYVANNFTLAADGASNTFVKHT